MQVMLMAKTGTLHQVVTGVRRVNVVGGKIFIYTGPAGRRKSGVMEFKRTDYKSIEVQES